MKTKIIITSFKEPKTIGRAIESALNQTYKGQYEIIVSAPDKETLDIARIYSKKFPSKVRIFQDPGKGKPTAVNITVSKAKGEILVLTDGDVFMSNNALEVFSKKLIDDRIGAASARVISIDSKEKMFGFWALLLTETFHHLRLKKKSNELLICSGYLYTLRKKLFKSIPIDTLADDAFISYSVYSEGYKTVYAPEATVYVRYPSNLPDWIKQKKRTAGRYYQLQNRFTLSKTKDFIYEMQAVLSILREIKTPKRILWFMYLIVMRLYIWFRIFFDTQLWNRSFNKTWQRVESTK